MIPTAGGPWLDRLNAWRTATGLPILTENTTWSLGDYNHALYMVKNNLVTHYETPGVPYYTAAGDTAARNSNIQVSSTTFTSDTQAIDWWMAAPFHALGMMDPRLTQTGFGSYREAKGGWEEGGALDVLRGNSFSGGTYPVFFPGNASSEPLTTYSGGEFPDPLQGCPGYSVPTGLPLFVEVEGNVATTAGAVHTLTGNGTPLQHCVIDSTNSAVGSNLVARGAVIIIPRNPLQYGVVYTMSLTVNGQPYTWTFTVGATLAGCAPGAGGAPTVTSVNPTSGPGFGGTTVTITGCGFTGTSAVAFGGAAATGVTVVSDSQVTAVSPAGAAGTVNVVLTNAGGSSAVTAGDAYLFTAVHFGFSWPGAIQPGIAFALTVTAEDSSNVLLAAYRGTVHFSSTDPSAVLPADYPFSSGDQGSHQFTGLVLNSAGYQTITVADKAIPAIMSGSTRLTVPCQAVCPAPSGSPGGRGANPAPPATVGPRQATPGLRARVATLGSPATSAVAAGASVDGGIQPSWPADEWQRIIPAFRIR